MPASKETKGNVNGRPGDHGSIFPKEKKGERELHEPLSV